MASALDAAIIVFRERGYHATSLSDLRVSMGLATGSIYKAFADKRDVFLAAFDRYTELRGVALQPLLDAESTGLAKLQVLFRFYAESSYGAEGRRGCLVVGSAVELATHDAEVATRVAAALNRLRARLRDLIRLGQSDGSVLPTTDLDATADLLLCVLQGLRVVGKTGRTLAQAMAARSWRADECAPSMRPIKAEYLPDS